MALSKLKLLAAGSATKKFTDRSSARSAFDKAIESYFSGDICFRVLTFYGVGGIGKTSLLRELGKQAARRAGARRIALSSITIDFDSDHLTSAGDALYALRRQWPGDCPLFEFALARYWEVQGRSLEEIQRQLVKKDSFLFDLVEAGVDFAGTFMPVKVLYQALGLGSEIARRYGGLRAEFDRIAELSEAELAEQLPLLLGCAIESWERDEGGYLLLLVDGHERLFSDGRFKLGKLHGDQWLRELLGAAERGLSVICGRNRLDWGETTPEWLPYMEQHILGRLSDADAEEYLSAIPVSEPAIRETIIREAKGVPLYLDICASIYLVKKNAGQGLNEGDFSNAHGELVGRLMQCMDRDQAAAVRALSSLACFDRGMFATVTRSLNIGLPLDVYDDFCRTSYVEVEEDSNQIAKIHTIVRERLEPNLDRRDIVVAIRSLLDDAFACRSDSNYQRAAVLVRSVLPGMLRFGVDLPPPQWARLAILCLDLADAGYVSVSQALGSGLSESSHGEAARTVGRVIQAHCFRRKGDLGKSQDLYRSDGLLRGVDEYLKSLRLRVRYQAAHVDHLLGDYASASEEYQHIFLSPESTSYNDSARWLARRQHGDILMLKGRFSEALAVFSQCENAFAEDLLWLLECSRFKGHVFRFNWDIRGALSCYEHVHQVAREQKVVSMQGKALVNIAESCMWTDPERAIDAAIESLPINRAYDNVIECGKASTAMVLAFLGLRKVAEAKTALVDAANYFDKSSYRAGQVFALGAKACLHRFCGDQREMQDSLNSMHNTCQEIGVYRFVNWFFDAICTGAPGTPLGTVAEWLPDSRVDFGVEVAEKCLKRGIQGA